ncbi:FG-GAP-like repeat-containing protein [Namhaeicola litoreus]|uniref:FG-GAP-like repeat-containing protein n=1 Tax=Namhaeicola litoreus TaxID=1052145 RepID=A0ABW3Y6E1_9FLAO
MKTIYTILLIVLFFSACTIKSENETSQKFLFNSISSNMSGIDFKNDLIENDSLNYFTYGYIYMGGGVSTGDINNDGLVDIFFTGNMVDNRMYLNQGNLKFKDITTEAGLLGDDRWYTGVTMVDINNDGFLDIYCSVSGKFGPRENQLFINNGNNTFTEKAAEYGLADASHSIQSTFFDYDLDGDLDLYVANYPPTPFGTPNEVYVSKQKLVTIEESDHLYRNDDGFFTNVTTEAGLKNFGLTNSATIGDLNKDGWPDIYVSNDFSTPDYFYINNQDGTFVESVKDVTKNVAFFGMGVDIADFNNDLLPDFIQTDMTPKNNRRLKANMSSMNPNLFWSTVGAGFHYQYMQNSLQLNNGNLVGGKPFFSNISQMADVAATDWSWGALFVDLDNDGWKDIFISNGTRREINNTDYFKKVSQKPMHPDSTLAYSLAIPSERIDNLVFKNNKDLTFSRVSKEWGISFEGFSNGCAYADLDNDGDVEMIVNNIDDVASVFENHSAENNNFITLRFKGPAKNTFGLGVKVVLTTDSLNQYQELTLSRGFQSSVAPEMYFGLEKANMVEKIKITWPDGKEELLSNMKANQIVTIDYKDAITAEPILAKNEIKLFTTETNLEKIAAYEHKENIYDDFQFEVLLPHRMSMFGPGIATGDLNGDGLDDLVVGGAANYPAGVFFQGKNGFVQQHVIDIENDKKLEDLGVVIFDADGDGKNDIYMVSGGNEFAVGSPELQDRLYYNLGDGNFEKRVSALPIMLSSGSRVKPFDFDKDGDLDLFVGGRLVPMAYPMPASSFILENTSTPGNPSFLNITEKVAPELKNLGMVTDGIWTDVNNDGYIDLMITGEWMPITVFQNIEGKFENVSAKMNLANSTGWWFSIEEGDFDGDGDMDYVAGNLGLNYKYKATENETFDIFYNDFDKNNKGDIVLSYYNEGIQFPVRGRSCSSQQIPTITQKFKNYEAFASASLTDVYTEKDLKNSLHYQAKTFASAYLENTGDSFKIHNLPHLAQVSSINKTLIDDFDKDGNLDILLAGNLYSSEVETPRNDASIGLLLTGNGKGSFKTVEGKDSGFFVPGDVKDMSTIKIGEEQYIIVAKNNDYLQFVKVNKS